MKFLVSVSNAMQRFATRKYIITLLALFIMIVIPMEKGPIGQSVFRELSGGAGMLDVEFGYSRFQVYNMLEAIGHTGRQLYAKLLGLDFIFAIVFMLFQSLMITSLLRRAGVNEHFRLLNLLPFVRSALDMIENCFILTIIFNYPVQMSVVVEIASFFTILKLVIYKLIIALLFSLGAFTSCRTMNSKRKLRKWSENV